MEKTPDDQKLIDRAFRAMHTITGSGATCEFNDVASFTHDLETTLDLVRNMKFGTRLALLGFGFVLVMLLMMGVSGYWGTNSISHSMIAMLQGDAAITEHAAQSQANVNALRRFEKDLFLNIGLKEKDGEYLIKWKKQYERLLPVFQSIWAATVKQAIRTASLDGLKPAR